LLRDSALKLNFVVSKVELRSGEVSFDQLPAVVQRIMAGISTPNARTNGLETLLNEWSAQNASKAKQQIFKDLQQLGIYPDMRLKLVEYQTHYNCSTGIEYEQCLQALKWFEGKETKSKTFKSVPEFIRNFVALIRSLGYSGLVVLLDEAEAIVSLSRIGRRDLANENVRQIIDNDQDTQNFYLVFASTPTFLSGEDERSAQSYPALWRRISDPLQELKSNSLEKVIIELPELTEEQFVKLASRIKHVYEFALRKTLSTVTETDLGLLAHYVQTRTDKRVGTMVRSTVAVLDEAAPGNSDFMARLEMIVEKVMQQEARDRAS
jgi:hypothetical protein